MLKCIIVDDEPLAREVVEQHLKRLDQIGDIIHFGNAKEAQHYLSENETDVIFLDIEMPEMTGIEFLKSLSNPPLTVFTTAYRNYAFEGFELGVIDFLLKPISFERLSQAMTKIRDFLALKDQNSDIENASAEPSPEFIFVKSGVQRIKLYFEDVAYIQGLKDYAILFTKTGKIVIKGSIKAMLTIFPSSQFIRVHKSFIVSRPKINRIERNNIIIGTSHIPVGRNFKEELERILGEGKI